MLRKLTVLVLALTLGGAAPLGAQQDVTPPEQVEALKERIADIDRWLADAEEDRSTLEQQLAATERKISTLTRERRTLRQQAREQQERLAELRAQDSELANTRTATGKPETTDPGSLDGRRRAGSESIVERD